MAVASSFRREEETEAHDGVSCWMCDGHFEPDFRIPCPARCRVALCSLECLHRHRHCDCHPSRACKRAHWGLPKFGERFAGKNARLTEAIALQGELDVQRPFDWHFGDDFFTPEGRQHLEELTTDPWLKAEHWAPCCKLFTRARGRPIRLRDGRVIQGPQPVRDAQHLMGFKNLSSHMRVRLRHSNQMALKSLKRLTGAGTNNLYESCEHPLRSWMWEFTLAKRLVEDRFRVPRLSLLFWRTPRKMVPIPPQHSSLGPRVRARMPRSRGALGLHSP